VRESYFPIKQLGPNRLSGVGGWGAGGLGGLRGTAPSLLATCKPNSLSTPKLLTSQRSFGGANEEFEQTPVWPCGSTSALLFPLPAQLQAEVEEIAPLIELDFWAIAHQRRASLHDQSKMQQARDLLLRSTG
jgi:hypothetical protein